MCCLFGLVDYGGVLSGRQKRRLLSALSVAAEARGTDATGIAYNTPHGLHIFKRPMAAHHLHLHIPAGTKIVMGHTRMATQGDAKHNCNNHPFSGLAGKERFAFAHNGMLYNDRWLQRVYQLPRTKIETDSYVAVQLIERKQKLDWDSLRDTAERVEGSFDDYLHNIRLLHLYPGIRDAAALGHMAAQHRYQQAVLCGRHHRLPLLKEKSRGEKKCPQMLKR